MFNLKDVLGQVIDSANVEVVIVENKKAVVDGNINNSIKPPTREEIKEVWNSLPKKNGIANLDCVNIQLVEDTLLTLKIDIK